MAMMAPLHDSIAEIWKKVHSLEGHPFPQTIKDLSALSVTRYFVDFCASTATSYTADGEVDVCDIPSAFDGANATIGGNTAFDLDGIKKALAQAQRREGNYSDFARGLVESGCVGYHCFVEGKNILYLGRTGEAHTEWFPGAKPKSS